ETPKMPLGVAAGIKAAAQTVFLRLQLDLGAGRPGALTMQLGIGDWQIEHVRVAAAHRARLDHEIVKHRVGDGADENAAVTQPQQDVFDVVVGLLGTLVLKEAEGLAQPARRGAGISIPQDRRHRCSRTATSWAASAPRSCAMPQMDRSIKKLPTFLLVNP